LDGIEASNEGTVEDGLRKTIDWYLARKKGVP
jgi:dTDP-D-glucose 4,6-dehydratase